MVITTGEATDKLLYSYMGIRILVYIVFFILNSFQTFLEGRTLWRKKQKTTTRFYIFLSMAGFTMFRILSTAFFYPEKDEYKSGTLSFFFFTFGTTCIFITWVFILHFWLLIMYSFFVSDEVKLDKLKPINYSTFIFVTVLVIYQITIATLSLLVDLQFAEAVCFVVLLLIYCTLIIVNGSILLKSLKKHKKNSPFEHYNQMIFKTKVLLGTLICVFSFTIIEEVVFQLVVPDTFGNHVAYLFVTGVVDTTQMIIVMAVLANGHFSHYILFKRVKTTSYSSADKTSHESGSRGTKKTQPSYDVSGRASMSVEYSLDMDTFQPSSLTMKNNNSGSNLNNNNSSNRTFTSVVVSNDENDTPTSSVNSSSSEVTINVTTEQ
ncbi:hypothetical protein DICPUDRAFT_81063 [Dictyostelium purpureum]|uniref:THH1/TOM1/TOM3 domain-containing protein n=1 Tax=Dictyostelium purpureum TaxID=5786 RepID=F0ZSD3_DICPU|nr:uncharacterized protein DICPUDRAFT_81063 [Dictyostelium purpureum]EGC33142.1 hypothetical protein DICPUDRAFT_81063 [Dictyostelium purpureum]|eukprot:XP_003290337.1 hypothetical protein DICPUDRAFT_81063 [Dictyostelium purpureum]